MSEVKRTRMSAPLRRQAILEAARGAFVEHGYVGAYTRLIAQRSMINEAVLYKHFSSKEELFEQSIIEPLRLSIVATSDTVSLLFEQKPLPSRAELTGQIERELLGRLHDLMPLLGVAIFAGQGVGVRANAKIFGDDLGAVVRRVIDGLGIPARPTGESRLVAILLGLAIGPALDAHFRNAELDYEAASAAIASMLTYGLSDPPSARRA